ncbi:hypothetical protein M419DRAFT_121547 [Trichoderma reesei RUT C-30]|uniref:Uncharacterized protein n=1 Tax=Hypocrea jecorina (strain ATCC 56765 / BCRC 32924 / NRRL 11460 / Rut C-30) TaxID=1344414 RepID=A0A024SK98_HYPJR|nr:hypothetical protein M419DRAFT_121547 [Trichoderma reesei RUT C-30]
MPLPLPRGGSLISSCVLSCMYIVPNDMGRTPFVPLSFSPHTTVRNHHCRGWYCSNNGLADRSRNHHRRVSPT